MVPRYLPSPVKCLLLARKLRTCLITPEPDNFFINRGYSKCDNLDSLSSGSMSPQTWEVVGIKGLVVGGTTGTEFEFSKVLER